MSRSLAVAAVLVVGGLVAFNASAQRYDDGQYRPNGSYDDGQYRPDPRYDDGQYRGGDNAGNGAVYDYARVVRVDPVIVNGSQGRNERCYERNDGGYVDNNNGYQTGGYGNNNYGNNNYGNNNYGNNNYGNSNGYRNDGYDQRGNDNGQYRQGNESGRQWATVIGGLAGAVLGSRIGGGDGRYLGTAVGTIAGGAAGRAIYEASNRPAYQRGDVRVCEPTGYGSESERVDGYDVTYEYAGRQYRTHRDYHPGEQIRVGVDVSAD